MDKYPFCILLCTLFLVGCSKTESVQPTIPDVTVTETSETTIQAESSYTIAVETAATIESEETFDGPENSDLQFEIVVHPSTGYAVYDALIEKCIWTTLHTAPDDFDLFEKEQIPDVLRYGDSDSSFSFIRMDLDDDGDNELLIYQQQIDDSPVYAAYSIENGQLVWLLKGGERNRYYICSDGKIGNEGSSGAMYSTIATYCYSGGVLSLNECYFTDDIRENGNHWFYSQIGSYSPDAKPISEEEFNSAVANIRKNYLSLDGMSLNTYMEQDEQAIRLDIQTAAQNENQTHGEEKYELWDTVLNRLWRILKYRLSTEEMAQLTREQLIWINQKETATQNTNSEDGFEIQAAYTKDRISELLIYLNK